LDRRIVYAGAIPLDLDQLHPQVNAMIGLGALIRATLGTGTLADGFAIAASSVPDLNVNIGPGSLASLQAVDASAFGSVTSNAAPLMKMGINTGSTVLACAAPVTVGHSRNYLIQATFTEADGTPVVLPYYNASNPSVPYTGPAGAGTPNNTVRAQTVTLNAKAGVSATTGTQTTPGADAGYVGLYVVTVAYGQTTITNANLSAAQLPGAPFVWAKLDDLEPMPGPTYFTSSGSYVVPNGVTKLRYRLSGGGGGGGGCASSQGAGGGGSGSYAEGVLAVTPGQTVTVTIGAGGTAGSSGGGAGGNGGTSSLAGSGFTTVECTGGTGGAASGSGNSAGGGGGTATGGGLNVAGGHGNDGQTSGAVVGGSGGASQFGAGGRGSSGGGTPANALCYGAGGGGAYSTAAAGGTGFAGVAILEPVGRA
jgi:hypothetical protein